LLTKVGAVNAVSLRVEGKPNYFSMRRTSSEVESANRLEFFRSIGFDASSVARGEQVHGVAVTFVERPGDYPATDSLVTRKQNLLLGISVADCVPILIVDRESQTIAAVHAGWRGTANRITAKTIAYMKTKLDSRSEDIFAFVGPSAGVCCYEVGEEVAENFPSEYYIRSDHSGKYRVDLKKLNFAQLMESGLPKENLEISEACTICDWNYHSYRRDGPAGGRMLAVIGLK
jgi:hypothetical protein